MLDISRERMEVAPTAHYSMGGIVVEPETHVTEVSGSTQPASGTAGLHGANRLAELARRDDRVRQTGRRRAASFSAGCDIAIHPRRVVEEAGEELEAMIGSGPNWRVPPAAVRNVMWERCGSWRDDAGLREGCPGSTNPCGRGDVDVRPSAEGWSDLAQLIDLRAGLARGRGHPAGRPRAAESRGCHNRADFRDLDPALQVNFYNGLGDDGRLVDPWSEPVLPVRRELRTWLERFGPADSAGHLLE